MPKPALIYAWTIIAIGTLVAVTSALLCQPTNAPAFWICLGLAALASTFKVKLPGFDSSISPSFVFQLVAAAQFTGPETIAVGMISALVQSLWKRNTKPTFVQVAFNVSTLAISSGMAYALAHHRTTEETSAMGSTLMLGVAGLVLLVVNTLMVSVILCLLQNTPIHLAWRSLQFWAFPYYLAGGVLASVWVDVMRRPGATFSVLAAVSVYLLSICYREAMQRVNTCCEAQT